MPSSALSLSVKYDGSGELKENPSFSKIDLAIRHVSSELMDYPSLNKDYKKGEKHRRVMDNSSKLTASDQVRT